jgi:4-hydroxythreonine-4-phosphate dehydrogenase
MGDPAGIGPEVLLQALADGDIAGAIEPLVFGDRGLLDNLADRFGWRKDIRISQVGRLDLSSLRPGVFTDQTGRATVAYLEAGARALERNEIDALVTGPIHKRSLKLCGVTGPGQTEWLAARFNSHRAVMLLWGARLKVLLATTHVPLRDVSRALGPTKLIQTIELAAEELRRFFFPAGPRLAIAALNPHGEQDGEIGPEEREIIAPAVEQLRERGLRVEGPISGDTVFAQAVAGRFDAVVALYHDQGLAPLKTMHFSDAVNVTLGLGVIRTAPDHGVAYDIAHQGLADPTSMKAAIGLAAEMVQKGKQP